MVQVVQDWSRQIDFAWTAITIYVTVGYAVILRGGPGGPSKSFILMEISRRQCRRKNRKEVRFCLDHLDHLPKLRRNPLMEKGIGWSKQIPFAWTGPGPPLAPLGCQGGVGGEQRGRGGRYLTTANGRRLNSKHRPPDRAATRPRHHLDWQAFRPDVSFPHTPIPVVRPHANPVSVPSRR